MFLGADWPMARSASRLWMNEKKVLDLLAFLCEQIKNNEWGDSHECGGSDYQVARGRAGAHGV
jgi:hypothetical protein